MTKPKPLPSAFLRKVRKLFGDKYADAVERGDLAGMKRHYFDTFEEALPEKPRPNRTSAGKRLNP